MKMKPNFLTAGWLLLVMAVLAGPAQAAGTYGYPITDPYAATVIGTPGEFQAPLLPGREVHHKRVELTVFKDRTQPDLLWFDSKLHNGLIYQNGKAPLIFIIAGTGGSYRSYKVRDLANYFYQAGFHAVALSSPTHPNFVAAASSTQYPGSLENDARDLYRVMQLLRQQIQNEIEVSDFYLIGYSLGATQAAFVAKLDDQYKAFNFKKVFMINPAVNLYNSVKMLDGLYDRTVGNNPARQTEIIDKLADRMVSTYRQEEIVGFGENFLGEDALYLAFRDTKPSKIRILPAIIGMSFRNSVANMVFVTDVANNAGYIKPKNLILYPTDSLTDYYNVAFQVSFVNYFNDLYVPFYQSKQPGLTAQDLIKASGLGTIEDYLKHADKIGVVTNQDEIILAPGELDFLRRVFGKRLRVYPHGGHCGNINYTENVAYMLQFFKN
ncbi:MAG: alpha/beta fold hydrolase [Candidatus Competibacteraceae bacterium]